MSKLDGTQVNTDVTLGGLLLTQDSHDNHTAARTDWANHDWGSDVFENFGLGKRHPGLSLFDRNGKEIPVLFTATPNALMDGNVLCRSFTMKDDYGMTQRGTDADGKKYYPFALVDGHISRIDEGYLTYINKEETRWNVGLGAPYGTSIWQFHDDERMNGSMKSILGKEKSAFFRKKGTRTAGGTAPPPRRRGRR